MAQEKGENRNPAQAIDMRKIFDLGPAVPAAAARRAARQWPTKFVMQPLSIGSVVRANCARRMEPFEFFARLLWLPRLEKTRRPRKTNNIPAHMRLNLNAIK